MAGQKKKLRYSPESTCFSEYYIGWIGISNCGQETSTKYILALGIADHLTPLTMHIMMGQNFL